MTHEPIKYKDSLIHIRDINANWDVNPKRCYCCGEPINKGKALLFINNHKYIPNILLHPECYDKQKDKQTLFAHIEKASSDIRLILLKNNPSPDYIG